MPNESSPKNRPLVNRLVSAHLDLTATQKWTLVCLLDHQNKKNGTKVWPSVARLVTMTGFSDSTVRRAIHNLEVLGFFNVERQDGASNLYYLNIEMLEKYLIHSDHTTTTTPVTVTKGGSQSDRPPLSERPDTLVTVTSKQSKEQSNGTGNLTGSEKSNRQKGEKRDFVTAREACLGAVGQLRGSS